MQHFFADIPGWCDFADLYRDVVRALPDGARIVEVGVWQGQSTAALGVEIANSGKAIRLDVVDWFQGSPNDGLDSLDDQRARFDRHVAPIRHLIRDVHAERSTEAARHYPDGSLDFVFIDAAHDSASVLADLNAWYPKVKPGGLLAGHDHDWATVQQALYPWSWQHGVSAQPVSRRCWQVRKPVPIDPALLVTPAGDRRCVVAVCSNERTVYRQTAASLLSLGWGARVTEAAARHGFVDVSVTWESKALLVSDLRNRVATMARGLHASHILFLDADMTWPSDVLDRMLAHHDQGIVSGLYHLKNWPHWPVALNQPTANTATTSVDYHYDTAVHEQTGLVREALVGMGCTLVPTVIFEAMPQPWFEYRQNMHGAWAVTEDVPFCEKAAALGVPIWVDPSVKCRHIGADPVGEAHYERARVELHMLDQLRTREAVPA